MENNIKTATSLGISGEINTVDSLYRSNEMMGHCKCKHCGQEANVDMSLVLTSYPPQYNYSCPHCGKRGYIWCSEAYVKNSHEDNQDKTIEELKEQIRQLEKRIKELEIKNI